MENTLDAPPAAGAVRRRSGRPSSPKIDESRIAEAALAIIDERGWPSLTMAALAARLGVRAPSLYHHIGGQDELVDLVRGLVVQQIVVPEDPALDWRDAFYRFGVSYYRAFARHPNTIQTLSTTPIRDPLTLHMYESVLRLLHDAGWNLPRAFEALLGVEHLALGFAYEWNAEDLMLDSHLAAGSEAPLLAEITRDRTEQPVVAESTFLSLLRRYIAMFDSDPDAEPNFQPTPEEPDPQPPKGTL